MSEYVKEANVCYLKAEKAYVIFYFILCYVMCICYLYDDYCVEMCYLFIVIYFSSD